MTRALLFLFWLCVSAEAGAAATPTIHVGSLTLTYCIAQYDGYCGALERPIDPANPSLGTISIGFEYYPHTGSGRPLGTIIAQEGGPGYSTTGSLDGYVRLFTPLRDRRNILLIDKRGTGRSGAIDCGRLQRDGGLDAVRACGRKIGQTAWLYSSRYAADDVAAVLKALHTGPVDYYGDSYATFFGEVFAVRHPDLVRTIVLDSAYPVLGETPYFQTEIENGPVAFSIACARSPSCNVLGGQAGARFKSLLTALRIAPVTGSAPGANGEIKTVTADAGALFTIIANAGNNFTAYRDIDAAARADLESQDPLPLLRLVAEAIDGEESGGPPFQFSTGLEVAVECADYKQLYDMRDDEPARHAQYLARLAATEAGDPRIYAPFRLSEAIAAVTNPEGLNLCQAWPQAPAFATPGFAVPADAKFPGIPVLVLSGELDTVTSPTEGRWTAALFPGARFIEVPNEVHETAIGNGGVNVPPFGSDLARCVGPLVLMFIQSGGTRADKSCLSGIRPVRTVPMFAASWQSVAPAIAGPRNTAGPSQLALASAVAETVGDAFARYGVSTNDVVQGLRGGKFTLSHTKSGYAFALKSLNWAADLPVSGRIDWDQLTGLVTADVSFATAGHSGRLTIGWNDRETYAQASIRGQIDGQAVVAARIAP